MLIVGKNLRTKRCVPLLVGLVETLELMAQQIANLKEMEIEISKLNQALYMNREHNITLTPRI